MNDVLFAWIGMTDLKASRGDPNLGPIAQAVLARKPAQIVLLNNYEAEEGRGYVKWLTQRTEAKAIVRNEELPSPTDYGAIYGAVSRTLAWARDRYGDKGFMFHLSPGTPAMAAIWIIVSKTQVQAELIESSKEKGVQSVNVPFELAAEFVPSLVREADAELDKLRAELVPEDPGFEHIAYRSKVMAALLGRAKQAAVYSAPILIEGESGTGKELLAKAVHKASPRNSKPLIVVNCGAISKDLVESEFFGHAKGSFTGATTDRIGHFEQANGGTLFLDEIGELPLAAQVKLLRCLQENQVVRIGTSKAIPVDVRVIAATNRDLQTEVAAGRFREDLYFRLAVLILKTPPLREREGDIGLLVDACLGALNREASSRPSFVEKKLSPGARNLLLRHSWPGNVRELNATLVRAFVWSRGAIVSENEMKDALVSPPTDKTSEVLHRPLGAGFKLQETVGEVVRHYLSRAMAEAHGHKTKAASLVGFSNYQTLSNWLSKYGVQT